MSASSAVHLAPMKGKPFRVSSTPLETSCLSCSRFLYYFSFLLATLSNCFYWCCGYNSKLLDDSSPNIMKCLICTLSEFILKLTSFLSLARFKFKKKKKLLAYVFQMRLRESILQLCRKEQDSLMKDNMLFQPQVTHNKWFITWNADLDHLSASRKSLLRDQK